MDVVMESANHGGGGERRRMIKPEYAYLHVMMRFEAAVVQMDARLYKLACLEAVRAVFGISPSHWSCTSPMKFPSLTCLSVR